MINPKDRLSHTEICLKCEKRKAIAYAFDLHFDWLDCPYDCPNDYDHYIGLKYSKCIKGLIEKYSEKVVDEL